MCKSETSGRPICRAPSTASRGSQEAVQCTGTPDSGDVRRRARPAETRVRRCQGGPPARGLRRGLVAERIPARVGQFLLLGLALHELDTRHADASLLLVVRQVAQAVREVGLLALVDARHGALLVLELQHAIAAGLRAKSAG